MAYWWVNQNKTFNHEVGDGYLWSPFTRDGGGRNQFYENMTLVQRGDIVFSYAGTFIKAIGVVTGSARKLGKPKEFARAGESWSDQGWWVPVEFELVERPIRPKEYMGLIAPFLPAKYSPLQSNGDGLQGVYLAAISDGLGSLLLELTGASVPTVPVSTLDELAYDEDEQAIIAQQDLDETVKATLVNARRGQGIFRSRVQAIESSCRVTGVSSKDFLIASHIKPWKLSDNQERLSGNNGLFLSPHVDKLFDKGFISFTRKGEMWVSPKLDPDVLRLWSIDPLKRYGKFNDEQTYFLEHHQNVTFQGV